MFKYKHLGRKRWLVILTVTVLGFTTLLGAFPQLVRKADAIGDPSDTYTYTDKTYQKITEKSGSTTITFNHARAGVYTFDFGSCEYGIATTSGKDGDASAKVSNPCQGGTSNSITIGGGIVTPPSTTNCVAAGNCGGDENATCESSMSYGSVASLSWILCPVFNGIADASDWMYSQFVVPFLHAPTISTTDTKNNVSFKVWSGFRLYGNIVLIIAMLGAVFGQIIGGGVLDAYTVKKMMPRILIAVILVNLSIYIMAFMNDVTNIVGGGLQALIWAPLKAVGAGHFSLTMAQSFGSIGIAALATLLGAASLSGIILGLLSGHAGAVVFISKGLIFVLFVVVIPVVLAILGVFVTLVIRRGILIFLVMSSPVAFALYALPNTEQYFRRWWNLFIRTLIVYPIVVLIFALADVLTVTILAANGFGGVAGTANSIIIAITAFVIQFLPLALIPFSFRMAGGVMGTVYNATKGGLGRVGELAKERQENARKDFKAQTLQSRTTGVNKLKDAQDKIVDPTRRRDRFKKAGYKFLSDRISGYNLELANSRFRAESAKEVNEQQATGVDGSIRGASVNKEKVDAMRARGEGKDEEWRINENGGLEYKSLGGGWVGESDVIEGHQRWDGNSYALQAILSYEQRKASTQDEKDHVVREYTDLARDSWGMNSGQAAGAWKGAGFENQNSDLEFKYMSPDITTGEMKLNGLGMLREIDEKKALGQMLYQSGDTWTSMADEVRSAAELLDSTSADVSARAKASETLERATRIAFATRAGSYAETGEGGAAPTAGAAPSAALPDAARLEVERAAGGGGGRAAGAGAPARVQEEINAFLATVDKARGERYEPPASNPRALDAIDPPPVDPGLRRRDR